MSDSKLEILINAKDEASKTLEGITGKIQGMSGQLKMMGVGMLAVGGAITATAVLSIKKFADMGDEVEKMSYKTGFSTIALSEWRHALEISGTNLDALQKGVKTMSSAIIDANSGLATYQRSFEHLGIDYKELMGLSPEEQFEKIAFALGDLEDQTLKSAVAQDIFGRTGLDLLPLLAQGKDGIAALRQEAHELGNVFTQEAATSAVNLKDGLKRIDEATNGLKMMIAEQLIPVLMPLIEHVKSIILRVREWTEKHPELFRMITIVVAAVGALLIPLGTFLIMLPMLSAGVVAFTAICSPWLLIIGALILAVGALAYAAYQLWKNWDVYGKQLSELVNSISANIINAFNSVVTYFNNLWHVVQEIFVGIANSMWEPIKNAIQWIIDYINTLIATLNRLFGMFGGRGGGGTSDEDRRARGQLTRGEVEKLGGELPPNFQHGGVMPYTGLAFLHKGETVLPSNAPIMIHNIIELDGRIVGENVCEYIAGRARLQGVAA